MMFLVVFLKCRLIKQSVKDMGGHPYTSSSLSSIIQSRRSIKIVCQKSFQDLGDEKDTSPKKHDQR